MSVTITSTVHQVEGVNTQAFSVLLGGKINTLTLQMRKLKPKKIKELTQCHIPFCLPQSNRNYFLASHSQTALGQTVLSVKRRLGIKYFIKQMSTSSSVLSPADWQWTSGGGELETDALLSSCTCFHGGMGKEGQQIKSCHEPILLLKWAKKYSKGQKSATLMLKKTILTHSFPSGFIIMFTPHYCLDQSGWRNCTAPSGYMVSPPDQAMKCREGHEVSEQDMVGPAGKPTLGLRAL